MTSPSSCRKSVGEPGMDLSSFKNKSNAYKTIFLWDLMVSLCPTRWWSFLSSSLPTLPGTYIPQAVGIALHPHEWRPSRQKNSTPPADPRKNYPYMDGSFSEDDWDKPTRYVGAARSREEDGWCVRMRMCMTTVLSIILCFLQCVGYVCA